MISNWTIFTSFVVGGLGGGFITKLFYKKESEVQTSQVVMEEIMRFQDGLTQPRFAGGKSFINLHEKMYGFRDWIPETLEERKQLREYMNYVGHRGVLSTTVLNQLPVVDTYSFYVNTLLRNPYVKDMLLRTGEKGFAGFFKFAKIAVDKQEKQEKQSKKDGAFYVNKGCYHEAQRFMTDFAAAVDECKEFTKLPKKQGISGGAYEVICPYVKKSINTTPA